MTNAFDKVINSFMKVNGGEEDEVIIALKKKKEELGPDVSETEIHNAIKSILEAHLEINCDSSFEHNTDHQEYLDNNCKAIQIFLDDSGYKYEVRYPNPNAVVYLLDISDSKGHIRAAISCNAITHMLRIKFVFPFMADETYAYPLSNTLVDKSDNELPLGSFLFDSSDGETYLEHSILTHHEVYPDDLDRIFSLMVIGAFTAYKDICKYCHGSFSYREAVGITEKATMLIKTINEDYEIDA